MVTNCLKSKFAPCSRLFLLPEKIQRTLFFFGKNSQPLPEASPWGEALPRSGGDEGQSDSEQFVINRLKSEFRLITWLPLGGLFLPNCRLRQLRQPAVAESD